MSLSRTPGDKPHQARSTAQQNRAEAQAALASLSTRFDQVVADLYRCHADVHALQAQREQLRAEIATLQTALAQQNDSPQP